MNGRQYTDELKVEAFEQVTGTRVRSPHGNAN